MLKRKIYLITDRNLTLSDSISRYIIDIAEGLKRQGREVRIHSSSESKRSDYKLPSGIPVIKRMPNPSDSAIFHFHLTYTIRKHTKFLFENAEELKKKTIVTLHVTPEYATTMGQEKSMQELVSFLARNSILVHTFSNYAKYNLKKHGLEKVWVVYPGIDLNRYKYFLPFTKKKKKQILVVASNPDSSFVKDIKGFDFLYSFKQKYKDYAIKEIVNLPFEEYLKSMAESEFYVALSRLEHYGLAIIDAYNLFTIPIYSNEGGLTEAIYGNGIPILATKKSVVLPKSISYNNAEAQFNFLFSQTENSMEKHLKNLNSLYSLL